MKYVYLILLSIIILSCSGRDPLMPEFKYYINNTNNESIVVISKTRYNNYSFHQVEQIIDTTTISGNCKDKLSLLKKGHSPEDTFTEMLFFSVSMDTIKHVTEIKNTDWICSDSIYVDGGWGYSWTYNFQ